MSEARSCPRCAAPRAEPGARFCPNCGASLAEAGPAPASAADARCAVHPWLPARDICTRCGAFACAACATMDLAKRPICRACAARAQVSTWDVPWERRAQLGVFRAYWETAKQGAFEPQKYLAALSPTGARWWDPASFAVVSIALSAVMMVGIYAVLFGGMALFGAPAFKGVAGTTMWAVALGVVVALVIGLPLAALARTFVGSGLDHVCLLLVGGGRGGFWATYRGYCYATAPGMFGLIPGCGGYVWEIWRLVLSVMAYKRVHEMSGARATVAALLPVVLCCGGYGAMVAGVMAFGGHAH